MAKLPSSGAISADDLRKEFGTSSSQSVSFADYVRGGTYVPDTSYTTTVPTTTSDIGLNDFYGINGQALYSLTTGGVLYAHKQNNDTFTAGTISKSVAREVYYQADSSSLPIGTTILTNLDSNMAIPVGYFSTGGGASTYVYVRSTGVKYEYGSLSNTSISAQGNTAFPNTSAYSASLYSIATYGDYNFALFKSVSSIKHQAVYQATSSNNSVTNNKIYDINTGTGLPLSTTSYNAGAISGGSYVAIMLNTSALFYTRSGGTFSSKTWNSQPASGRYLVSMTGTSGVTDSTSGGIILFGYDNTALKSIYAYYYNGSTVNLSTNQPATSSTTDAGIPIVAAWDPTDTYLAVLLSSSSSVPSTFRILKRTSSGFTWITPNSGITNINGRTIAWDSTGTYLALGYSSTGSGVTGTIEIYKRSGDTFSKIVTTGPGGGTTTACFGLGFYPPCTSGISYRN